MTSLPLIEKFDHAPNKYYVTEYIPKKKFDYFKTMWEDQYGQHNEKEMARLANEIRDLGRTASKNGEGRSDIDDDVLKHSGKTVGVRGLDRRSFRREQSGFNTDEGVISGDTDRSGNGAAAGQSIPEVKFSTRDSNNLQFEHQNQVADLNRQIRSIEDSEEFKKINDLLYSDYSEEGPWKISVVLNYIEMG